VVEGSASGRRAARRAAAKSDIFHAMRVAAREMRYYTHESAGWCAEFLPPHPSILPTYSAEAVAAAHAVVFRKKVRSHQLRRACAAFTHV